MTPTETVENESRSIFGRILDYVVLPKEVTAFEQSYLERMNRIARYFFYAQLPIFAGVAAANGTGVLAVALLTAAVLVVPFLSNKVFSSQRVQSMSHGFTAMCMGGVLVHAGQGPVQIEMHFYFFSVLAMLALFANPMVVVTAAGTVATHHLALWYVAPNSVFNYDAPLWVVLVHAAFVVLETVAASFIARNFFDNVIGLEKKVEARTAEVNARNRDMRLVLDNVRQGLVTVDLDGVMAAERSASLTGWFGEPEEGTTFAEYIGAHDSAIGDWLALSWDTLTDGFMPLEVVLDQFPKTLNVDGKHYSFTFEPILDEAGEPEKLLVIVSDITSEVEHAENEQRQLEVLRIFKRVISDRPGFVDFYDEACRLLEGVRTAIESDVAVAKRLLHTLKGNTAIYGLVTVAGQCHSIEDCIAEGDMDAALQGLEELEGRWLELSASVQQILGEDPSEAIVISQTDYEALLERVIEGDSHGALARMLVDLSLEPTEARLERLAEHAQAIAERLEKGAIEVCVEDSGLRLERDRFQPFWSSLTHVLRNAVDHGIEAADEREASGKAPEGKLAMRTFEDGDSLVIEIQDDGRGIDWSRVAEKAQTLGLESSDERHLVDAIFHSGLSTRENVTDTSGRGVGLAAVREACEELGGEIAIESEPGAYTKFQFRFPASVMASYPQVD